MYDTKNPEEVGNGWKMYNAANNEGHEGRMFEFTTPSDGSFTGGHNIVKNTDYWRVGCLGITEGIKSNNKYLQDILEHLHQIT